MKSLKIDEFFIKIVFCTYFLFGCDAFPGSSKMTKGNIDISQCQLHKRNLHPQLLSQTNKCLFAAQCVASEGPFTGGRLQWHGEVSAQILQLYEPDGKPE